MILVFSRWAKKNLCFQNRELHDEKPVTKNTGFFVTGYFRYERRPFYRQKKK